MDDLTRHALGDLSVRVESLEANQRKILDLLARLAKASKDLTRAIAVHEGIAL